TCILCKTVAQTNRSAYQISSRACARSRPRYLALNSESISIPDRDPILTAYLDEGPSRPKRYGRSSRVVFPRMFSNCASEVGPAKLLPAKIQRKDAYAHAVVCARVVNRCVTLEMPQTNTWAGNALRTLEMCRTCAVTNGSPCPHAALCASQTSTLVHADRAWMVALRLVSSAKRMPRIWNT
ncbi:hypothetical protein B0H13DRAFT_2152486, partial [Mycena leptocephala]